RLNASLACYSAEVVKHDQQVLKDSSFLQYAKAEYGGEKGGRYVSYIIKGKPLDVRRISSEHYGEGNSCSGNSVENLPLRIGDVFSAFAARQSVDQLTKNCSEKGSWVEVREEDRFVAPNQLDVVFHVLTFPVQTILADGKRID